jgi:hypothetical protein
MENLHVFTLKSALPDPDRYRDLLKYSTISVLRSALRGEEGQSLDLDADESYHLYVLLDFLHDLHFSPLRQAQDGAGGVTPPEGSLQCLVSYGDAADYAQRLSLAVTGVVQLLTQRMRLQLAEEVASAVAELLTLQRNLLPPPRAKKVKKTKA